MLKEDKGKIVKITSLVSSIALIAGLFTAYNVTYGEAPKSKYSKAVIAYARGTCEAPTFVAYHKGFLRQKGYAKV